MSGTLAALERGPGHQQEPPGAPVVERQDPRGRPYYWIGGEPPSGHLDEGTDIWAVANGYVSITPVHLDMTAYDLIPALQDWQFP